MGRSYNVPWFLKSLHHKQDRHPSKVKVTAAKSGIMQLKNYSPEIAVAWSEYLFW